MAAQAEEKQGVAPPPGATAGHGQGHGHGSKRGHGHGHGGGGHEEHEGAPEWLISFADNVMLQMGFFVILFSIAMTASKAASSGGSGGNASEPSDEQLDFALSVREAFNNPVDLGSQDPRDARLVARLRARMMGSSDAKRDGQKGRDHDVRAIQPEGIFRAGGRIPFAANTAELDEPGRDVARELAHKFRGLRSALNIRGHCSAAEAFEDPIRGVCLSHERAMSVARVLVEEGVAWTQIRITACSDTERVTQTAYDAAGHATNQRVDVIQLDEAVQSPP